jgi:transcription factor TFIIIB component B''
MDPPTQKSTAVTDAVVDTVQPAQSEEEAQSYQQQETSSSAVEEQVVEATHSGESIVDVSAAQATREEATASRLPWVAVNRPQQAEDAIEAVPALAKKTRNPPKPRGKKSTAATAHEADEQEVGEGEGAEGGEAQSVRKRPSAKARGKRRADPPVEEDGTEAHVLPTRARRPRKVKSKATVHDTDEEEGVEAANGQAEGQAEEGGEPVARQKPKPRQPKRKRTATTEVGEGGEQVPTQPKRKGRPPREPTPSDAEEQEIDPENTFMNSIASRNIRVGKLSKREKAMREIDWEDVKRRRREEDTRKITSRADLEAAEKLQIEEVPVIEGPRYVMVDGQIQLLQPSTMIDREAEADREIENYEIVEERSLTTRITSRSFLKNNKRFPNDFILPGQGKRWTAADTELFYEGLQHFGTDFQMISHMFPGSTRRSIKLKFTREERDDPARVREILLSRSTINSNWDDFMQASQMNEEKFADADEIKRQLAEEEAEFRERIAVAKLETEERKRQQREAGLLDDEDENGEQGNKENGKGKKKRKGKEKQVTFQEEAGVEIVGNVDDDATWGQE